MLATGPPGPPGRGVHVNSNILATSRYIDNNSKIVKFILRAAQTILRPSQGQLYYVEDTEDNKIMSHQRAEMTRDTADKKTKWKRSVSAGECCQKGWGQGTLKKTIFKGWGRFL